MDEQATTTTATTSGGGESVANAAEVPVSTSAEMEAGQELSQPLPDFFADEEVTEAELMGEDIEEKGNKPVDTDDDDAGGDEGTKKEEPAENGKGDDSRQDDDAATAKPKEDDDGADEGGDATSVATKKPPEGFVPYQALSEERTKRQTLAQRVADLQAENEELKQRSGKAAEEVEEFKVLSNAEFDELLEDDPQEAIRYQHKLQVYQADQREKAAQADIEAEQINIAASRIQQIVPGIYDEDSNAGEELGNFAVENGLDPHFLTLLTDPRTKVVAAGSKGAVPMGDGAASVVQLLHTLWTQSQSSNNTKAQEEAIRESLREEITAEVMNKFKGGSASSPGVLDAPGNADTIAKSGQIMSEEDFARLTAAEQEKLLAGV